MNQLYPKARQKFLNGDLSWRDDNFRCVLVDTALYTFSTAHEFLSDIPIGARAATLGVNLSGKTSTDGVADASDITFTAVAAGPACEAVVVFRHTGVDATADLVAYIDSATGLPVTPIGTNIAVAWDNGALRMFKL